LLNVRRAAVEVEAKDPPGGSVPCFVFVCRTTGLRSPDLYALCDRTFAFFLSLLLVTAARNVDCAGDQREKRDQRAGNQEP
jgi:hypothetical protein